MLALARFELQPLDVVDIGVSREQAPDVAARAAIGVIIDADPERVALGAGKLPFEAHALAGKRSLDVGVVELIELAALDLDDLAAADLAGRLACPLEKRAIDEAVTLVRVDITDRHAERIQLALRQRQQCLPLAPFAMRLQRRMVEAG